MPEPSQATKKLISQYALWKSYLKPRDGVTIHVDEVASKVAAFYEQIRTIVDWKEEHLMRRAAIMRKLKRRFLDLELSTFSAENMAERLVPELIRGGYFPNDKIEESRLPETQKIIEKYVFILKHSAQAGQSMSKANLYNQIMEIAACEIEETIAPSIKEMSLIDYMFSLMRERIKISEKIYARNLLKPEEKDIQIYIAVQQALFKLDEPIISYNLLKYKYPYWENPSEEELLKISQNIYKILETIEKELVHPLGKKFYFICEKYDTPYLLLGDILAKNDLEKMREDINDPAIIEGAIRSAYAKRLADLKTKIKRAAIYSTASIFATKVLSLIILEVILQKIGVEKFSPGYLVADVLIPTTLMALLITTIKPPSTKNLNVAVMETMKIIYEKDKQDTYEIKLQPKRGIFTRMVLALFYVLASTVSFGLIFSIFIFFNFPATSITINIIFIALVLFAGTAIRTRAKELTIHEESAGVLIFISDILMLPVAGLGRWMSNKWKRYNFVVVFLNVLIDMPFSAFVEFLEMWRYFIKDRKEDLR